MATGQSVNQTKDDVYMINAKRWIVSRVVALQFKSECCGFVILLRGVKVMVALCHVFRRPSFSFWAACLAPKWWFEFVALAMFFPVVLLMMLMVWIVFQVNKDDIPGSSNLYLSLTSNIDWNDQQHTHSDGFVIWRRCTDWLYRMRVNFHTFKFVWAQSKGIRPNMTCM